MTFLIRSHCNIVPDNDNSRDDQLHDVVKPLFAAHHHDQLNTQLKEVSASVTIISAIALKINKNKGAFLLIA